MDNNFIIHFSTQPRAHLDYQWLLTDSSSATPPIVICAVVRISARGFFYTSLFKPVFDLDIKLQLDIIHFAEL